MKLKLNQTIQILNTLVSLDGYDQVVDGKAVRCPYDFTGKTRWNITKNISVLKRQAEVYEQARKDIIKAISPDGSGGAIDADPALRAKFIAAHTELLEQEDEVAGLLKLQAADLVKDNNPIPSSALVALADLIEGEPA